MLPLVRRARTRDDLEGDTILATFGLLFVLKGAAQLAFTPDNRFYNYLNTPVQMSASPSPPTECSPSALPARSGSASGCS